MGWHSVFEDKGCKVTHRDFQFYSPIKDNLCWWKSVPQQTTSAFTAASFKLDDWHECLGHVSRNVILNIKDKVEGLVVVKGGHLGEDCEPCALGKHHRRPFQEVDKCHEKPLELVHSDLCCKFPVEALGGGWYFFTFMDDCMRFCVVFILKDKESRTLKKVFEMYKAWAENQWGYKLKAIHTDGGGEYEKWMGAFLRDSGIEHQTMAPYTPESNGILEWMNCTLMEMMDPMMARAEASPKLWAEVVKMACYIRNRLPTSSLDSNITPYEAWTGNVPSIAHIRKFGCLVYRHIPKQTCKKLEHKAKKGILVGYESESGMYRVYHPQNDTIVVSRDLLIFENKINAMVKHPFMDFTGIFDDVDEEASMTTTRPIFDEIEVLPPPKATVPAIMATQQRVASPVLSPAASPSPSPTLSPAIISPAASPVAPPVSPARTTHSVQPSVRSEQHHGLHDKPPVSYRVKDGGLHKARFCAKGFTQRWGEDYDETYAPVTKYTSIRTLFAIAAGRRFKGKRIHQMDVKTAFLCSKLKETIYVRQPEGFVVEGKEDWVYRLKRSLYGLKQSSREWYKTITPVLEDFGFVRCESDHSIFVLTRNGYTTYIALYVDDLLIISENDDDLAEVKRRLMEKFEMKDLGVARKFLGMEI